MKYEVRVTRDGRWWMVEVPEVDGLTQARRLGEVELMARELIAVTTGAEPEDVEVELRLRDIGAISGPRITALSQERRRIADLEARNARETREVAAGLVKEGVPLRDVGEILGVSYQRVHQLVRPT